MLFQFFGNFLLFTFSLEFSLFVLFFRTKIAKLKKFEQKEPCWLGGRGLIWLFNARISPNYVTFTFTKETKLKYILTSLVNNPPFATTFSTIVQLQIKLKSKHIFAIYFLQLLTNNVEKYKSWMKLQSKVYATCQHHNSNHYVQLLANLVENWSSNIVKGCCQLHSTNGWTSSIN